MRVRYSAVVLELSRRPVCRLLSIRGSALALATLLLAAGWTSPAAAQDAPNPDASSVEQYVELVPTTSGPAAPGVGSERRVPLPPAAKRALEKTTRSTADALLAVATSSTYGAPATPRGGGSRAALASVQGPSRERSLRAVAAAATPDGVFRAVGLLLVLAAITVGAAAVSVRRRF